MQLQIFWQYKGLAFVPPSPIEHHDDIVVRIALRHLIQKDLHALGIDMRKHEAIEAPIHRTDCAIGIGSAWQKTPVFRKNSMLQFSAGYPQLLFLIPNEEISVAFSVL